MDRIKSCEDRWNRRIIQKRICLASLLNTNLLHLGAGIALGIASCGTLDGVAAAQDVLKSTAARQVIAPTSTVRNNPYVAATGTLPDLFTVPILRSDVRQTSDMRFSELRLKSIGTAVGLVPFGNSRDSAPAIEISAPSPSKIRVNPMAGGSLDLLEPPITDLAAAPETDDGVTTSVMANRRPGEVVFSFSDDALLPDHGASEAAPTKAEFLIPPPVDDSTAVAIQPTDLADMASRDEQVEALPLVPVPIRLGNGATPPPPMGARYPQRRRQHVDVTPPPMISAARPSESKGVSSASIVPARMAGYVTERTHPQETTPASATREAPSQILMREIRESHPTARISVSELKDRVIVRGVCRSREQAIEIVRMIRSRHLVHVDDQLVIR